MKHAITLLAAAGLAASAHAQSSTRLIFEASFNNGATWQGGNVMFSTPSGATLNLLIRARVALNGTDTVLGLAGLTFQPKLTGWGAADTRNPFTTSDGSGVAEEPQTNTGRILPFASSGMGTASASGLLTSHVDGGNTLRFAGANAVTQSTNLAWGVSCGQTPRSIGGTNFRGGTNVVVFRYSVSIPIGAVIRDFSATADLASILQSRASWYRTDAGTGSLFSSITANDISPVHISGPLPTPGALALLGFGSVAAVRRRR